jgi:hypothetical protein
MACWRNVNHLAPLRRGFLFGLMVAKAPQSSGIKDPFR